MKIIRKRTEINGYYGLYPWEKDAKPSYMVEIFKEGLFGKRLIRRYYMIFCVDRTLGIRESKCPSVPQLYGNVVYMGYRYYTQIYEKFLRKLLPALVNF